ncbi:fimbrial protein [Enterobacillus tribolii]|nr:fimbrial protein [Enterobacillus tribolii]
MTIYPMALGLNAGGEGSVKVISKSGNVQYIKTNVFRIENPATPQEKEVAVKDSSGNGLVVMPPKFAIPGGAGKRVNMVAMEPQEKETLYRVKFLSVPSLDDNLVVNDKTISSEVSVNLVWGVLVSVPPRQPVIHLSLSADNTQLLNQGTQRVKIIDVALCRKGQSGAQCSHKKDNHNLFPDGNYALPPLAGTRKVEITYKDWIKNKTDIQTFSL